MVNTFPIKIRKLVSIHTWRLLLPYSHCAKPDVCILFGHFTELSIVNGGKSEIWKYVQCLGLRAKDFTAEIQDYIKIYSISLKNYSTTNFFKNTTVNNRKLD